MPSFYRVAMAAAAMLACPPAWADVPCPSEDNRQPDSPPYPTITNYTVTRSTAPAGDRTSGSHDVTVIGGDAVEGAMRVDLQLSSDLPRNCPLIVAIVDPAVPDSDQRLGGGDVAKVLRIVEADRIQVMAANRTETGYHQFWLKGDGTNRLVLHAKTRGQFGDHTARLGLRIRGQGPVYPFTITRRGLPDMTTTLSTGTTRFGNTVEVVTMLPFTPGPGMIDEAVTFTVKPAGAGNFRRLNQLQSLAPTLTESLDADLTPRRAIVRFVPAGVPRTLNAVITATLMGRSNALPIIIRPVPTPCKPKGAWEVIKGGLKLTVTNEGELPCPRLQVTVAAAPLNVSSNSSYWTTQIFPSPETPEAATRSLAPLVRAAPPSTAEPISWTGSYTIAGPAPATGAIVTATLRPEDGTFPTITLPPLAVPAASIGKSR